MVDKIRIGIGLNAKDQKKLEALKQNLLYMSSKKHKVDITANTVKAKQDIKEISSTAITTNKVTNKIIAAGDSRRIKKTLAEEMSALMAIQTLKKGVLGIAPRRALATKLASQSVQSKVDRAASVDKTSEKANKSRSSLGSKLERLKRSIDKRGGFDKAKDRRDIAANKKTRALLNKTTKSPLMGTGGTGGTGGSGAGGGKQGFIHQMPQNPLLGRLAQFGMMASGMAATMFLMQMITAQLRILMTIITDWEDAILKVIDSTSLTSDNMDGLAEVISSYARNLGIASTAMAEATGAAFQYGIDPTQANVGQLYALQFSDNVKDYKEAASIMNMAGTEFGDKAATAYIKKWDAYAGTGKTSGTFGYEWEKLKEAGKDAMKSIWDADYGAKITDSLRNISNWISTNREAIVSTFDKMVAGLSVFWKMLKVIRPAAAAFLLLFVGTSGLQLFSWLLTSMSKMMGPLAFGFSKSTTEIAKMTAGMSGAAKVGATLKATLISITPVFIAMAAAWAAWEVGKKAVELYKIYKISKDMKELTTSDYLDMSSGEREKKKSNFLKAEEERNKLMKKAQADLKIYEDTMKKAGKNAVFDSQFLKEIDEIKKIIAILEKQSAEYKGAAKKVTESEAISLEKTLQAINADSVVNTVEWKTKISLLEKVNKELGYMTPLLLKMKQAERKAAAPINIAAMGPGKQALIDAKKRFQDKLKADPEFKQIRDLITSATKRDDPSMNAAQLKKIDWELIKGMMNEELEKMDLTEKKRASLTAGLKELSNVYHNIKIAGVTLDTDKYKDAMKTLNEEIDHFNESAYQKKVRKIDEQFKGDEGMKGLLQERLYLEEKKKIEQLQGRRPDDDQRKSDLEEAFKFDKKLLDIGLKNLELVGKLGSAERALLKEREKGLGVISDTELKLKLKVDLLKIAIKYNLNPISDASLKRIEDSTKALSQYNTIIKNLGREITIGQLQTDVDKGRISELQKEATIKKRIMEMAKLIEDQEAAAGGEDEKKALKEKNIALITYQENIRQLESFQNQASVAGMEQQYQIKKKMSDDYYQYQLRQIEINYKKNEHDVGVHYAEMVEREGEYQLQLKDRRNATNEIDMMLAKEGALRSLNSAYKTSGEIVEDTLVSSFNKLSDSLFDIITGAESVGKSFKKMAKSIIDDLTAMIIKQMLFNMVAGIFGSMSSGSGTMSAGATEAIYTPNIYAKGGVVSGISSYSNSIVSTPTYVGHTTAHKYATGGAIMGEAGPEAIMPLSRMADGNLGVEVKGGGDNIIMNNTFNIESSGDDENDISLAENIANMIEVQIKTVMVNEKRFGGILY